MRRWTPEERQRQAELIRNWQPWKRSTGPKTGYGKNRTKLNALKHGLRGQEILTLQQAMRECQTALRHIEDQLRPVSDT